MKILFAISTLIILQACSAPEQKKSTQADTNTTSSSNDFITPYEKQKERNIRLKAALEIYFDQEAQKEVNEDVRFVGSDPYILFVNPISKHMRAVYVAEDLAENVKGFTQHHNLQEDTIKQLTTLRDSYQSNSIGYKEADLQLTKTTERRDTFLVKLNRYKEMLNQAERDIAAQDGREFYGYLVTVRHQLTTWILGSPRTPSDVLHQYIISKEMIVEPEFYEFDVEDLLQ